MAKQVITLLTDDLDGSEAQRTVEFGLDGVNYTIDLSEKNAEKLHKVFGPYLAAGTRTGRSGGENRRVLRRGTASAATPERGGKERNRAIREWAVKNGHAISERGRIPRPVIDAFDAKG